VALIIAPIIKIHAKTSYSCASLGILKIKLIKPNAIDKNPPIKKNEGFRVELIEGAVPDFI
jgi:hypothetical protein